MSQFTPVGRNRTIEAPLNRRIAQREHDAASSYLERSAIEDGFYQDLEASEEKYIPDFLR
jgi:hypothetical protein